MVSFEWSNIQVIQSRSYTCGYCGRLVASDRGWPGFVSVQFRETRQTFIYICHFCGHPTYIDRYGSQHPGAPFGSPVGTVPDESVRQIYDEARNAVGANCYTAAVLCCRKLLMHIAVSKGAEPGQYFASYVQYLADHHYIPPDARNWVDHIREKGNEANHEIAIMSRDDAEELVSFSEMLLKVIFEFPARTRRKASSET